MALSLTSLYVTLGKLLNFSGPLLNSTMGVWLSEELGCELKGCKNA